MYVFFFLTFQKINSFSPNYYTDVKGYKVSLFYSPSYFRNIVDICKKKKSKNKSVSMLFKTKLTHLIHFLSVLSNLFFKLSNLELINGCSEN